MRDLLMIVARLTAVLTAAGLAALPVAAADDPPAPIPPSAVEGKTEAPPSTRTDRKDLKAGDEFRDCPICPEMVVVPPGSFLMGDRNGARDRNGKPVHEVKIPHTFAVGKYEITFDEWTACMAAGACTHNPDDRGWGRGRLPVTDVTWNDAKAYIGWLAKRTGKPYRMLTEAEWEYMARAGSKTKYPWGNDIGHNKANCDGCGSRWSARNPAPVGQFKPNGFGIHDTVGNVWEWVEDCWHKTYKGAPSNGEAWIPPGGKCRGRVLRGGSWYLKSWYARSAVRDWNRPVVRSGMFGIRVALTLSR